MDNNTRLAYTYGLGMFGGPGGTYGRYSVGNFGRQNFEQERWEEMQRRRFNRRREPGYTGAGTWYFNYPNMVGALGAGTLIQSQQEGEGAADMANGVSDTSFGGGMP